METLFSDLLFNIMTKLSIFDSFSFSLANKLIYKLFNDYELLYYHYFDELMENKIKYNISIFNCDIKKDYINCHKLNKFNLKYKLANYFYDVYGLERINLYG